MAPSKLTFPFNRLEISPGNMQPIINIFWGANENNETWKAAFDAIVAGLDWDLVERLYMYLWRSNWNLNPNDQRHNMQLKQQILFDARIVNELKKRYDMKNRLMRAWSVGSTLAPDEFQYSVLILFL